MITLPTDRLSGVSFLMRSEWADHLLKPAEGPHVGCVLRKMFVRWRAEKKWKKMIACVFLSQQPIPMLYPRETSTGRAFRQKGLISTRTLPYSYPASVWHFSSGWKMKRIFKHECDGSLMHISCCKAHTVITKQINWIFTWTLINLDKIYLYYFQSLFCHPAT